MGLMIVLAIVVAETFKLPDRIGLLLFGALVAGILVVLGRVKVSWDDKGITLVNPFKTHHYAWGEVLDVTFEPGQPWPYIDLADGSSIGVMGIQGSEGAPAQQAVEELRAMLGPQG